MEVQLVSKQLWNLVYSSAAVPTLLVAAAVFIFKAAREVSCVRSLPAQQDSPKDRTRNGVGVDVGAGAFDQDTTMTELIMEKKLLLARLERTTFLCHALAGFLVAPMAWECMEDSQSQVSDVFFWFTFNFFVLVMLRPAVMTARVMEVLTCAFPVLLGMFTVSPLFCSEEAASLNFAGGNIAAIMLCLVRRPQSLRKAPIFCISMLLFALCGMSHLWHFYWRGWSKARAGAANISAALGQAAVVLAGLWYGSLLQRHDQQLLTTSLHLDEVRELHAAATALLNYSFDLMLEVDADGNIVSPASELSSLMLQPWKRLQGTQLASLFTLEADRAEFQQRLRSSAQTAGPEGLNLLESMAVGMQDANGCHLSMELLWFGFRRHGQRCFMVGVRESSCEGLCDPFKCQRHCERQGVGESTLDVDAKMPEVGGGSSEPSTALASAALASAETGDESDDEYRSIGDWELCDSKPAVITVNAEERGLPVKAVSPSFLLQFGRMPLGESFLLWVKNPRKFQRWLQTTTNTWFDQCPLELDSDRAVAGFAGISVDMKLKLPHRTVGARCNVLLPRDPNDLDLKHISMSFQALSNGAEEVPRTGRGTPPSGAGRTVAL